ncbi:MAG: Gfo/Idh/MocA family oxidoreductase, partial [Salinirussus sp.]
MVDVGILGLDTSHGEAFATTLAANGASIAAIWDTGTVRDDEYVASVCEQFDATRYDDPAALIDVVDAALVLTVDWDRHVDLAVPFLETGIPTLIDKPVAGSMADLDRILSVADPPLYGGSALPFHPDFAALRSNTASRTVHLVGYNDFYYYRVHVVDAGRRLVGSDWQSVHPVRRTDTSSVEVTFADGSLATLRFDGPTADPAFGALAVGDRTRTALVGASEAALDAMYDPYLSTF